MRKQILFHTVLSVIAIAFLIGTPARAENSGDGLPYHTLLGVHNGSLDYVGELGVQVVRTIVKDQHIDEFLKKGGETSRAMQQARKNGVEFVVTTRWPANFQSAEEAIYAGKTRRASHLDRIPQGKAREAALNQLERFLIAADGQISWYQIQNEVFGGPGYYTHAQFKSGEADEWLEAVAKRARETIDREHLHIKIISPAFPGLAVTDSAASKTVDRLLQRIAPYCDAVDIHLHRSSLEDLTEKVRAMQTRMKRLGIKLPLVTLEWSQAKAIREQLRANPSAADVLRQTYRQKMSPAEWEKFVASFHLEPDYMRRSYEFMNREGFLMACWAPMSQYGSFKSPILYDVTALRANRTVGKKALNEVFAAQYRQIASQIQK